MKLGRSIRDGGEGEGRVGSDHGDRDEQLYTQFSLPLSSLLLQPLLLFLLLQRLLPPPLLRPFLPVFIFHFPSVLSRSIVQLV